MSTLILMVIFGVWFAWLATQNTVGTTLRIGSYELTNIPLYLIALGSLLLGLLISWIINTLDWISSALTIKSKEGRIAQTEREIDNLQTQIRSLELENARLRGENKEYSPL